MIGTAEGKPFSAGANHWELAEAGGGATTAAGCRKHEISEATFYTDRARSRGLEVSDAKGLKALEVEHATSAHVPVIGSD